MEINAQEIKARTNLRTLVEADLGKPKFSSKNYDAYPCPFHHGRGSELAVYDDGFKTWCGCENGGGDAIAWIMAYHKMGFSEACHHITGGNPIQYTGKHKPKPPRPKPGEEPAQPPAREWQQKARKVVSIAEANLWSDEGKRAMSYLKEQRGLTEATIKEARLGYIPGQPTQWKTISELSVPCGILIPHFADGELWAVKVRRATGTPKYVGIKGGSSSGLYWSDKIIPGDSILITEGEFDCLLAWQLANFITSPVALGSASNHSVNPRWYSKLITSPLLLVRMDNDNAGQKAQRELAKISRAVRLIQVPEEKDITDYHQRMNNPVAVFRWIEEQVKVS